MKKTTGEFVPLAKYLVDQWMDRNETIRSNTNMETFNMAATAETLTNTEMIKTRTVLLIIQLKFRVEVAERHLDSLSSKNFSINQQLEPRWPSQLIDLSIHRKGYKLKMELS